ncbi:MAG: aspartate carbamoyltransferase, partial [Candidatus Marinimicrobia bacterium]|nr:aspartate carbamoyltransferase [Candidatus Neomarinimicrobiota bacterium]
QRERMGIGLVPSNREYRRLFGVTSERINRRKKELVIMHPGPMNRGVEIDSQVADSDQAIILDQVLNGVASRMSILYLLLGVKEENTNEG